MIVQEEELLNYLGGNDLTSLEGRINSITLAKLIEYDKHTQSQYSLPAIDYLFLAHQRGNKSLRNLAKEVGVSFFSLRRIFDFYNLPTVRQAEAVRRNWQDPQFRERNAEAVRRNWQDPQFRERNAEAVRRNWQDPQFRERQAEAVRRELYQRWQDPQFRERQAEAMRRNWQDPQFRERNAEAVRRNWQDPQFRERQAEAVRRNWQDPQFRERNAEAVRRARLNPRNIGHYIVPTIHGYRSDIGFDAQSTWEANFARILLYLGRVWYTRENFRLRVPEEFRGLFKSDKTQVTIDFVVRDARGNLILYEIMAHPLENPKGYAKLEMLIGQYDYTKIRIIDKRFYNRLKRHFEQRINSIQNLNGWETDEDNLRTNLQRYQSNINNV